MQKKLLILCLVMLILRITNPNREQHERAYSDDVDALSEQIIEDENINFLYKLGGLLAKDFSTILVKATNYHDYFFFSILSTKKNRKKQQDSDIVTIGILNYVYVNIDHESIKEMLRSAD